MWLPHSAVVCLTILATSAVPRVQQMSKYTAARAGAGSFRSALPAKRASATTAQSFKCRHGSGIGPCFGDHFSIAALCRGVIFSTKLHQKEMQRRGPPEQARPQQKMFRRGSASVRFVVHAAEVSDCRTHGFLKTCSHPLGSFLIPY